MLVNTELPEEILTTLPTEELSALVTAEYLSLQVAAGIFLIGALISLAYWFTRNEKVGAAGWVVSLIATLVLTASLIVRWINVGHIPYVKLYETYLFCAWSVALIAVIADRTLKSRIPSTVAAILTGLTLVYIIQWPDTLREGERLSPVLRSPWLDAHIAACFLSYAGFAISAGVAIVYLVNRDRKVDELSYKLISFAFPLLGLGIILGAVWAGDAWGRYWGWDPKESAALVTWLVYAGYLHARMVLGWKGVKAALLNLAGFACVLFTWIGLTLVARIMETGSLHLYTD